MNQIDDDYMHVRELLRRIETNINSQNPKDMYLSLEEETFLGRMMFEAHPWDYPLTPDGKRFMKKSQFPERTRMQLRKGELAKTTLSLAYRRLVFSKANYYYARFKGHIPLDECEMNGFKGMAIALQKYDYRFGYKFGTYATLWIYRDIHRGSNALSRIVDIPAAEVKRFIAVQRDIESGISEEEACERNGMKRSDYVLVSHADTFYTSLDTPLSQSDEGGATLGDVVSSTSVEDDPVPDPSDETERMELMRALALSIASLPDKQKRLLSVLYSPDRMVGGHLRPISDTKARESLSMSKKEYTQVKQDAMDNMRRLMQDWRDSR